MVLIDGATNRHRGNVAAAHGAAAVGDRAGLKGGLLGDGDGISCTLSERGWEDKTTGRIEREGIATVVLNNERLPAVQAGYTTTQGVGIRRATDADIGYVTRADGAAAVSDGAGLAGRLGADCHGVSTPLVNFSWETEATIRIQDDRIAAIILQCDRFARGETG